MTARFFGTDNPAHLRVIDALRIKPQAREAVDSIAGVSNGPDVVLRLRAGGLEIPCERVTVLDRDNKISRPGIYHLTQQDRRLINEWRATHTKKERTPC